MPYTPPSTVTGSDVLTAALWNTQIRDNFAALFTPPSAHVVRLTPLTLTGSDDIPWEQARWDTNPTSWSASDPTKVIINTDGIYLISASIEGTNTTSFSSPPVLSIRRATAYTIARQLSSPVGGSTSWQVRLTMTVRLFATDVLQCRTGYAGGGVVTVTGASNSPSPERNDQSRFSITWLGSAA